MPYKKITLSHSTNIKTDQIPKEIQSVKDETKLVLVKEEIHLKKEPMDDDDNLVEVTMEMTEDDQQFGEGFFVETEIESGDEGVNILLPKEKKQKTDSPIILQMVCLIFF